MNLYNLRSSTLHEINPKPFKLERDIQGLVEQNLEVLFGLEFICTEFSIGGLRIDTLAYDRERKAFVIIEYKKGHSYSVVDQGYSYLSLLLNNKADFVLEYFERTNTPLRKQDVDWSQSRVIFISPEFSKYQLQSIEFKDLPFELWEIKRYANDTVSFNQHRPTSNVSIKTIEKKGEDVKKVDEEIRVYTSEDHFKYGREEIREVVRELHDRIMDLTGIECHPMKHYIGYKLQKKLVTDVEMQKNQFKVRVNLKKGLLNDPQAMFRDMSGVGHLGVGDYEAIVTAETDLDYLMTMIKQGYKFQLRD